MIRKTAGILFKFSKASKIPRPRDPTVAESFQTKLTDEQIKILIDPKGFMSEEDRQFAESNKPQQNLQQAAKQTKKPMEPQYGYKPKGPQPTRFGDWEVKGKCVDF